MKKKIKGTRVNKIFKSKFEQKAFTLIELLAVIIILAVIALIAVPIIGNIIEDFKENALKDSAYGLVEASNIYYTKTLDNELTEPVSFDFVDNNQTSEAKLDFKGKINNGKVILNTDGNVVLCISDGKYYAYKEITESDVVTGKGSCSYDGETGNFNIISDIDTLNQQIRDLQAEITDLKNLPPNYKVGKIDTLTSTYNYEVELGFKPVYVEVLVIRSGTVRSIDVYDERISTNVSKVGLDTNNTVGLPTSTSDAIYTNGFRLNQGYEYSGWDLYYVALASFSK